jgi:arylsulfatase A-like enzyme
VETPSIDRLAAEGTRFLDAISPAPWTLPAMASVMTGVSPLVHGVRSTADPLPSALTTLAEHLRNRGYHTGAIGSNPTLAPGSGMDQGFLEYHWFPRPKTEEFSIGASILRRVFPRTWQPDLTTRETTDRAIAWYRERRDANTFLWLHYIDPHIPDTPPPEYFPQGPRPAGISDISVRTARLGREVGRTVEERSWVRSLYEAEVRYVDHEIGRLLAALREMGLLDDMLIVFMSDHGEEFWDHEGFEHGHTMYQELLRVPLIVRPPGRPAPSEFGEVVSTECALPTILDLCRIPFDREGLTGTSLARIWDPGMPEVTERPVLSAAPLYFDDRLAVTSPDLKYIRSLVTEREMLYDRRTDEHEGSDIAQLRPDACRAARATLEQLQARMLRLHTTLLLNEAEAGFPDESMIGRLRSLGYVN